MSDIEDLDRRLKAALERIDRAIESAAQTQPNVEPANEAVIDQAALDSAIAQARDAEAKVAVLQSAIDAAQAEQVPQFAQPDMSADVARLSADVQALQAANQQLRDNNTALRAANEQGLADAELINQSAEVELIALRAARAADRSELDMILTNLRPIIEETA
jgi:predicted RNase H-like nuclease (RuvC/YqgF family)